jgi:protein-disulfide isomerase
VRLIWTLVGVCAFLASAARSAWARSKDDLKREVESLKEGQAKIEAELATIEKLLRQQAGVKPEILSLEGAPHLGNLGAKVAIIEFGDYQCHFCGQFFREEAGKLRSEYIETGKLIYAFRDFPLEATHGDAVAAAEAVRCAGEQGKYWPMHDELFSHQDALGAKDVTKYGEVVGLRVAELQQCLETGRYRQGIARDIAEGTRDGVLGTPTFFLGLVRPDRSSVEVLRIIRGDPPYSVLKEFIESALNGP